jgi:transcriptional regulator with XRE-family HTH domain
MIITIGDNMAKNTETLSYEIRLRIAANTRAFRKNQGLTQEELAHRAKLALRHLQKIEAAEVNVTLDTLAKLSSALNIDVAELFKKPEQERK